MLKLGPIPNSFGCFPGDMNVIAAFANVDFSITIFEGIATESNEFLQVSGLLCIMSYIMQLL